MQVLAARASVIDPRFVYVIHAVRPSMRTFGSVTFDTWTVPAAERSSTQHARSARGVFERPLRTRPFGGEGSA